MWINFPLRVIQNSASSLSPLLNLFTISSTICRLSGGWQFLTSLPITAGERGKKRSFALLKYLTLSFSSTYVISRGRESKIIVALCRNWSEMGPLSSVATLFASEADFSDGVVGLSINGKVYSKLCRCISAQSSLGIVPAAIG